MQPAAPMTDNSGKPTDITHGIYFMPDALSLGIALGLTFLAALALRWFLVRVLHVPNRGQNRVADAIFGVFLGGASYAVYSIMKAMSHP